MRALFDTGAGVVVMDKRFYEGAKRRLGGTSAPIKQLKMADGKLIASLAHWEGEFEVEDVRAHGSFEVLTSSSSSSTV